MSLPNFKAKIRKLDPLFSMAVCPNCGKESLQSGGVYCSFCGAALQSRTGAEPKSVLDSSIVSRLEKVTKRVERLGYLVIAETAILLIVLVIFYLMVYGF